LDAAVDFLRKKGVATAAKKSWKGRQRRCDRPLHPS
jgi:translation elongation factor EF-Ts